MSVVQRSLFNRCKLHESDKYCSKNNTLEEGNTSAWVCGCISNLLTRKLMTLHLLMCRDSLSTCEWVCVSVCVLMHWLDRGKEIKTEGQSEKDQYFCGETVVLLGLSLLFLSVVFHQKKSNRVEAASPLKAATSVYLHFFLATDALRCICLWG